MRIVPTQFWAVHARTRIMVKKALKALQKDTGDAEATSAALSESRGTMTILSLNLWVRMRNGKMHPST